MNINPEFDNREEQPERRHGLRDKIAVGLLLGGIAIASWHIFDKSGDVEKISPIKPQITAVDDEYRQISWNMHNETSKRWRQINNLIDENNLDAVALQEVSSEDFKELASKLPDMYATFVMADAKSNATKGGYGNVILSKHKPEQIKSISLSGSKFIGGILHTATGFVEDVAFADTTLENTGKGFQADRSALAVTLPIAQGGKEQGIRVITSHIAGDERVHDEQLGKLIKFVDSQSSDGRPTVFCGDLNDIPENIIPEFAKIGFITSETKGTWTGPSNRTIDYCSYSPEDKLGLGRVSVLDAPHTDHYPLLASWEAR